MRTRSPPGIVFVAFSGPDAYHSFVWHAFASSRLHREHVREGDAAGGGDSQALVHVHPRMTSDPHMDWAVVDRSAPQEMRDGVLAV